MKRPHDSSLDWDLLHAPAPGGTPRRRPAHQRARASHTPDYKRWALRNPSYERQYAGIYAARLAHLRAALTGGALLARAPSEPVVAQLIDVRAGERCWVVGTLFKDTPLRPSALDEYAVERGGARAPVRDCYASAADTLTLEDQTGRAKLTGAALDVQLLCTGLVVALLGRETEAGEFHVDELLLPGLAPQTPRPPPSAGRRLLVLVSGLRVASAAPLPVALLCDWLSGQLGSPQDAAVAADVVRVVVCGSSLGNTLDGAELQSLKHHHQHMTEAQQAHLVEPLQTLDTLLGQVASAVPVDLMPGADDPANVCLPQQPFNVALFPVCSRYSSFSAVTNPYRATLDGVRVLGTAGQPLDDLRRYCACDAPRRPLDWATDTLRWRHLCPTAPDTLPCFPFAEGDDFVLTETPHLYFAGNQARFETCVVEGPEQQRVRVVMVPAFDSTRTAVVVDLASLDVMTVRFDSAEVQ